MASQSEQFPDVHAVNPVYDVVIVGAGIQGSASAYTCVKQGLNTLLLEQFSLPHSRGSSHGQSRIIRYSYDQSHYSQMMTEAFPMWKELEKETNTKLYKKTGLLTMSLPPRKALYENSLQQMRKFQRPHRVLNHEDMKREFPELDLPRDTLCFMDYDGGTLRADKALRAYQDAFKKRGGILKEEQQVVEIIPGTVVTVRTDKADYRARHLIITPGAWAKKVLRPLGLEPPLKVLRINVPYWQEKEPGAMSKVPNMIFETSGSHHVYSLQELEYPGLMKMAYHGGEELPDPDYRDTVHDVPIGTKSDLEYLKKFSAQYFPRMLNVPSIVETCMYTVTPDEELIIDRHPIYPNITVCCGCSGHGFKLAPSIGKILCRMAMGKESHIDIKALTFKRFKNSCLINKAKL